MAQTLELTQKDLNATFTNIVQGLKEKYNHNESTDVGSQQRLKSKNKI